MIGRQALLIDSRSVLPSSKVENTFTEIIESYRLQWSFSAGSILESELRLTRHYNRRLHDSLIG